MIVNGRYVLILVCIWLAPAYALSLKERLNTDLVGLNTSEIFRKRGYAAEDLFVEVTGGYLINVVHAWNPLIPKVKKTIVMIHGILTNANCFLYNSIGARPKDNSSIDFDEYSLEELYELFEGDANADTLPFLGLNNGMEFFMVNRRGTDQSMGNTNPNKQPYSIPATIVSSVKRSILSRQADERRLVRLLSKSSIPGTTEIAKLINSLADLKASTFGLLDHENQPYYEYKMDEQAKYDIPQIIAYILRRIKRKKVSIVAHSAGSALVLMSLVVEPKLADSIEEAHLYAAALDLGNTLFRNPLVAAAQPLLPLLNNYLGPTPPKSIEKIAQSLLPPICTPPPIRDSICSAAPDIFVGPGAFQQKIYPALISNYFVPISTRELIQLGQSVVKGTMHFFDYLDPLINEREYGQPKPPEYPISNITFKGLVLWAGNKDRLVTPEDVEAIARRLKVPVRCEYVNQTGVFFNHVSFFAHKDVAKLVIIKTLKLLSRRSR